MSYELLSQRSEQLSLQYTDEDGNPWGDSPFSWLRNRAPGTKGKAGRDFATALIQAAGVGVTPNGLALQVNGQTVKTKLSLMGEAGTLIFQQIKDDDFDYLICIGLYPVDSYGWIIPKSEILVDGNLQDRQGLTAQHVSEEGIPSDYWITNLDAANPFAWLAPFGGTTEQLTHVIQQTFE